MKVNQKYDFSITPYIDRGRKALYPDENRIERRHWMWNESGLSQLYYLLLNHFLTEEQRKEYYKLFEGRDFIYDVDMLINYCLEVVDDYETE